MQARIGNVPRGDTRANGLTIKLSSAGRAYLVYIGGTAGVATADLIFDVTGYYRVGTGGLRFYPLDPRRIATLEPHDVTIP